MSRLAPSPEWMQQKTYDSMGIRPINNLVDITKLCYGRVSVSQCMHMTYDTIAGNKIVVRRANDGEKFVTLRRTGRESRQRRCFYDL
ncbi:MAG: phenylalanine--tRNA ligase beta subunit-related protein [Lachnospira eligens]